ncbi:hypothetical protein Q4519_21960, partial [Motilimonas sp. 1_MG-2023]|uniref:hypothetical protein n=1 Tax=Motilimonas sp. 1_MG-2023 TaxID=3062672 RepID=UPI0026E3D337
NLYEKGKFLSCLVIINYIMMLVLWVYVVDLFIGAIGFTILLVIVSVFFIINPFVFYMGCSI